MFGHFSHQMVTSCFEAVTVRVNNWVHMSKNIQRHSLAVTSHVHIYILVIFS